ncbi:SpoIIE family protein phosphatase [Frankia sp. CNm7]|uniref:SpoIIE family protein phosphatase n=1 Tax=Frankia nepalensis TaxID=1836974 RepID=A0A937RTE5_9ACTN|nr:SpoIIE family protein phosphatase [Frankia nepalensis]MBL7498547.1 SpoIIE family protein phosphatase [Frankia nepalensis]MBL7515815.1 SpoIIE family protein phosphatase [Frankia nepalensis]MBL7521874.1 SpoIIE family protein phosphatase [Frankia nepalensis]MBL7633009.1 SpoIIE family protein phosphatase [Frankia nepalensis]
MDEPKIDYEAVFRDLPSATLLLAPELIILAANEAYLRVSGRRREDLLGRYLFDAFPDNPEHGSPSGVCGLGVSLRRVLATGERDTMAIQRYDVKTSGHSDVFEERYWSTVNTPVLDPDGQVALVVHRVEETTDLVRGCAGELGEEQRHALEAELMARARELHEVNEQLRRAHAREREVALTLQEAMLPALAPTGRVKAAVRYQPAASTMNVCGDWYDLVELSEDRVAVAVGDVVGHGLSATGTMGQLRSALSAVVRVADGPAAALEVLDRYARSVKGAESTTVVQAVVDYSTLTVTYSRAGHPPPALACVGGDVELLDQTVDPPLGASPEHLPRSQATATFADGATLTLYTDGLIERREENVDVGLSRLADSLGRHAGLGPDALADALLAEVGGADREPTDDTAIVVIRL